MPIQAVRLSTATPQTSSWPARRSAAIAKSFNEFLPQVVQKGALQQLKASSPQVTSTGTDAKGTVQVRYTVKDEATAKKLAHEVRSGFGPADDENLLTDNYLGPLSAGSQVELKDAHVAASGKTVTVSIEWARIAGAGSPAGRLQNLVGDAYSYGKFPAKVGASADLSGSKATRLHFSDITGTAASKALIAAGAKPTQWSVYQLKSADEQTGAQSTSLVTMSLPDKPGQAQVWLWDSTGTKLKAQGKPDAGNVLQWRSPGA